MKKSVKIHVNSSQRYGDYADQINTSSVGEYSCCKNVHTLEYAEELEGNLIVCNTLVLKKEVAELNRTGAVTSQMFFEKGKTTDMGYHTDFGQMDFKINTHQYHVVIEEEHIHVLVQYDLIHNSEKVSTNILKIDVDF